MALTRFYQMESDHLRYFGPESVIGYDNPEVHRLLLEIHRQAPLDRWPELFGELAPLMQADAPMLFVMPTLSPTFAIGLSTIISSTTSLVSFGGLSPTLMLVLPTAFCFVMILTMTLPAFADRLRLSTHRSVLPASTVLINQQA